MNRRTIIFAILISIGTVCMSDDVLGKVQVTNSLKRESITDKIYNERFGGRIKKPGTGIGATGFIIVGNSIEESEVTKVISTIASQLRHEQRVLHIDTMHGLPTRELVVKNGLATAVFVVSDAELPSIVIAPEDRWAVVNIVQLRMGLKNDLLSKKLYEARCRGELQRAFCYVNGGGSSQYDGNIMDITEANQIDSLNPDLTVVDTIARCRKYLTLIGVTQPIITTYSRACKDGWAPAPTNDVQKAIWDKVHAMPTEPIKIKPEAKKTEK